jgi:peptidoglycan/LPS O-acetylase OafA/YrhL
MVIAATILIAHLSYQFFERPFLRLKGQFTFVRAREDETTSSAVLSGSVNGLKTL